MTIDPCQDCNDACEVCERRQHPAGKKLDKQFEQHCTDTYQNALYLLLKKHEDYGPKNISNSPGGPLNGLRVRMHDKLARINHLVDSGATPQNESLEDSFLDLMNYAAIGLLVLKGEWPND